MTGILDADGLAGDGTIGGAAPAGDLIKESDTANFGTDVIDQSTSVPVIVDFWAPWCGPCKQLTPTLEKLIQEYGGKVKLVKINVDDNQELAAQLRVQSIPMVFAFKDGRPVDGFSGALPESQLRQFMEKLTGNGGSPLEQAIEQADGLLAAGDFQTASAIYTQILSQDPLNAPAHAGVAKCLRAAGNDDQARDYLQGLEADLLRKDEIKSVLTALELAEEVTVSSGETESLRLKVEENPDDPQLLYDYALALYGDGQSEDAVEVLVGLVDTHSAWNEEAARLQLLKIFEALGHTDPVTVEGRRKLSKVLFS